MPRRWKFVSWLANRWIDAGFVVLDHIDRKFPIPHSDDSYLRRVTQDRPLTKEDEKMIAGMLWDKRNDPDEWDDKTTDIKVRKNKAL